MTSILDRIIKFNDGRNPKIVPYKFKVMSQNMFSFYRGTCHIFYEDLVGKNFTFQTPKVWGCGDLHLENFGSYKGNNRLVYFDLNDFDEAVLLPASWEIIRMVTSIYVAFASLKIDNKQACNLAKLFLQTYSKTLAAGKAIYIEPKIAKGIVKSFLNEVKYRKKSDLVKKKTASIGGKLSILMDNPKHKKIEGKEKKRLINHVNNWIQFNNESPYHYEVRDAALRIAGTSSLGLNRFVFLLRNTNDKSHHILLEMKQAIVSALMPYLSITQPSWENEALRIVSVQNWMQNVSPALASVLEYDGKHYIMQELQPASDSIDFKLLKDQYRDMYQVINDMAMLTASSHLRSSGRQGSANTDELIEFGKATDWHDVIISYSEKYTMTVKSDYDHFRKQIKSDIVKLKRA